MSLDKTKQVTNDLLKVATKMALVFKDGQKAASAIDVLTKVGQDEELKAMLFDVYNNIDAVKVEIKDVSTLDFISLAFGTLPAVKDLIAAVNK